MRMNKVENVLYQLGIYPSQAGYPIAQTAIALAIKEPSRLQRLTLDFYPEVGKQCGCTPACVERSLRISAARAWDANPKLLTAMAQREIASRLPQVILSACCTIVCGQVIPKSRFGTGKQICQVSCFKLFHFHLPIRKQNTQIGNSVKELPICVFVKESESTAVLWTQSLVRVVPSHYDLVRNANRRCPK